MSVNEQHEATKRARKHRAQAEELLAEGFTNERNPLPTDVQVAVGMAAIVHLLLAVEDRLNYGSQSMLDGTISCRQCRVILLEGNAEDHYKWHRMNGEVV